MKLGSNAKWRTLCQKEGNFNQVEKISLWKGINREKHSRSGNSIQGAALQRDSGLERKKGLIEARGMKGG